ncbi:MAG: hypothetical protein WC307_02430 [Candidatus Nanoarchaeia archaeon]|jgi:hypothetical protein
MKKVALVDWGKGVTGLDGLPAFLADIFPVKACDDVLKVRQLLTKPFNHWLKSLDSKICREYSDVIGVALMPYVPSTKALYGNNFDNASLILNIAVNSHNYNGSLISIDVNTIGPDRAKTISIHELFEVFHGRHETHDGRGQPCANNGDLSKLSFCCSLENTLNYIDSLSPFLCGHCDYKVKKSRLIDY